MPACLFGGLIIKNNLINNQKAYTNLQVLK